jgi:hypothetical protein
VRPSTQNCGDHGSGSGRCVMIVSTCVFLFVFTLDSGCVCSDGALFSVCCVWMWHVDMWDAMHSFCPCAYQWKRVLWKFRAK